ncbi:MAG TPA: excinuclease ABC subunit UvrC, partial [Proteobacteria bacterium]|nr:excinuclease ABC subunit UvrC [Pseudomonadota bacterium]
SRLGSYFSGPTESPKVRMILAKASRIEFVVTGSEKEALLLENQFIKRHKPPYNIKLRDDKDYICLKIDPSHPYPRLVMTRRIKADGSRYFGPYSSAQAVRDTLKWLQSIFPLRRCSDRELANRTKPCVFHQIGRCSAPRAGLISEEEYREIVEQAIKFLEGKATGLIRELKSKMQLAADNLEFERAAWIRDRIAAIEKTIEGQKIVAASFEDKDAVGIWREWGRVEVAVLSVRGGKLIDARSMGFVDRGWTDEEVIEALLQQYYSGRLVPDTVLLPVLPPNTAPFEEVLSERAGKPVRIAKPRAKEDVELVKMATENARELMYARRDREKDFEAMLERLKSRLRLPAPPRVIDAFDISTLFGTFSVGSRVRFTDGEPDRSFYRRYKVKSEAYDDTARMAEVLARYFERERDDMPDMILLDGGKGQLRAAERVRDSLGLRVPLVAIAKGRGEGEPDRFYIVGRANPVKLAAGSSEYRFLQRIRDEAHRFAISYHRKLRRKAGLASVLDEIDGIGPKRKRALLQKFRTVEGIG